MNITVIGTGFVGVVSAAVYASLGHQVTGLDVDEKKIISLEQGKVPFYEPNLEELLVSEQKTGRLKFTTSYHEAISQAEVIIIAVGTPSAPDGQADLKFVMAVSQSLAPHLSDGVIVVVKSTVPPGTLDKVAAEIKKVNPQAKFSTASLPEFLREGSAVEDTLHPNRVVIGADAPGVVDVLRDLHQPFGAPIIVVSPASAQMAKYAANAYLATRITFANQIADLCEKNGADVMEVLEAIGLDRRIGSHYWYPGLGYGGSCFPKDVKELAAYSRAVGEANNLLNKINELNENRIPKLMDRFGQLVGGWKNKKVAILGLAFKPNTDDLREAPSLKVIPYLVDQGAEVVGFDPKAKLSQKPETRSTKGSFAQVDSIAQAVAEAEVIMLLIEWPEIISFDYGATKLSNQKQWLIDTRDQFEPDKVRAWGYEYIGIGR